MMKKLIELCFCISAFLFLPALAQAQTPAQCHDIDFTATTQITNSTCLSNGSITVNISGDLSSIYSMQYALQSNTGSFSINPQTSNVLTGIPPGTYTLTVSAFCVYDQNYSVVKSYNNISVGGNYTVPQVSLNSTGTTGSRKSYPAPCNTGIIVLNVTGGSGNFTFNITSSPDGTTGPVTATKNGTTYRLQGDTWPAGTYAIQVIDGSCYTATANFTLGTVSEFPAFSPGNDQNFRPDLDNTQGSCNVVKWYANSTVSTNPDWQRYLSDGMYEVGAAPIGQMPAYWTNWTSNGDMLFLKLAPSYTAANFYSTGANTIAIYTRVKNCTVNQALQTYIRNPYTYNNYIYNCSNYKVIPHQWGDYDGILCYPLTMTVTTGSTTVYSNSNWLYSVNNNDTLTLNYGTTYTISFRDQNNKVISTTASYTKPSIGFSLTYPTVYCNGYTQAFALSSSWADSCFAYPVRITAKDAITGTLVVDTTVNNRNSFTPAFLFSYDRNYNVTMTFADNTTGSTTLNRASTVKTATLTLNTQNSCIPNNGSLYLNSYNSSTYSYYPVGTTFTVTGPPGYTQQTFTVANTSTYYYYFPATTLPPGDYTLTYDLAGGGCPSSTTTFNNPGLYDYTNFGYTQTRTCAGLSITPTGTMTYQQTAQPNNTFFRLTSGPAGYSQSVILPGGSVTLSAPGDYRLGIMYTNSSSGCVIKDTLITYTASPLTLNPNVTSAYVCVGSSSGVISLSAINGVAPYTYELWDSLNTTKQPVLDITTSGVATFFYGKADTTYTVRVSDACGNKFNQPVEVSHLETAHIAYSLNPQVCIGENIQLNCITLGSTGYSWTGPNGFSSNLQNPTIPNGQPNMSGMYRVDVLPQYCGSAVKDSILITVYPALAETPPTGDGNQTICVFTAVPELNSPTVTGGSGVYTYQWQSSPNGASIWTNIAGATGSAYQPAVQTAATAGTYYYRRLTTDRCGIVTGSVRTLTVKPCYIPVNPGLMNKVK